MTLRGAWRSMRRDTLNSGVLGRLRRSIMQSREFVAGLTDTILIGGPPVSGLFPGRAGPRKG